jgi:hypothetical protein
MMIEANPENSVPINPDKKYFTAQARRAHVREYQSSGESMIMYCDKRQLALSTFKLWVTKYGEKKIPAAFVPMSVAPKIPLEVIKKTGLLLRVEIHTADIKIVVPEVSDIETFIQLIRGLSHANPAKSTGNLVL